MRPSRFKTPEEKRSEIADAVAPKLSNVAQHWLERRDVHLTIEESNALRHDMVTAVVSVLEMAQPRLDRQAAERSERIRAEQVTRQPPSNPFGASDPFNAFELIKREKMLQRERALEAELARRKAAGLEDLL